MTKSEIAAQRKRSGQYNCAQAVAGAFADMTSLDEATINAITSGFGTGMGTMDGTCGAIVGSGVIAGLIVNDRIKAREVMKRMMTRFSETNGSTICRALKGVDTGCPLRDCHGCCADAAQLLADELERLA